MILCALLYIVLPVAYKVPVKTGKLIDLIVEMPYGDMWHDADMVSAFQYVRMSRLLKLPEEVKPLIPASLPETVFMPEG